MSRSTSGRYLYSFVSHGGDGLGGIELPSILVCGAAIATFLMLSENSLASSWGMQQTIDHRRPSGPNGSRKPLGNTNPNIA